MEWDSETLHRFLKVFRVNKDEVIKMGIPKTSLDNMLYVGSGFTDYYEDLLTALFKAKQIGKITELNELIMFYQNFK